MQRDLDILAIAQRQPVMQDQLSLLQEKEQLIPGSVQYVIRRFKKQAQVNIDDTGLMVYHYKKNEPEDNYLELRFCITGNVYCNQKNTECDFCKNNDSKKCVERVESIDVVSFKFSPAHLSQFVNGIKQTNFSDNILNFKHTSTFSKILPLCGRTRIVLQALLNHSYTDSFENIYINKPFSLQIIEYKGNKIALESYVAEN